MTESEKKSFLKIIFERRVPQIVGLYLGACWALIQFIDFLVTRYVLSPYLTDFSVVIFISLLPSIILLAYSHGKPGRDKWTRAEKIGIPVNAIVTAVLLFFIFSGKELGAASKSITLEDEEGNRIERVVPKQAFRKHVLLFFFDNKSGDSELDWAQYGLPYMLGYDLSQDLFMDIMNIYESGFTGNDFFVYNKMRDAGFGMGLGVPLALRRKIANEVHKKYFVSGSIGKSGDLVTARVELYSSKNGKLITEREFQDRDLFSMIDKISVQLKLDLGVPKRHVETVNDLPVAEIFTSSQEAAKNYITGLNTLLFSQNWLESQPHFQKAVEVDPTFAAGYVELQVVYLFTNQNEKRAKVFEPLMQHIYKLPERIQHFVKAGYYDLKQQPDKHLAVIEMVANLYPEYTKAHYLLAVLYGLRHRLDDAIAQYQTILKLDPEGHDIYQKIGALFTQKGEFDRALEYYERYASEYPDDPKSFTQIGSLNQKKADFEQAKASYERALLLAPEDISVMVELADIDNDLGNSDSALRQLTEALAASKSAQDSMKVYIGLENYFKTRGQINQSLKYAELKISSMQRFSPPLLVMFRKMSSLDNYVLAGKADIAFRTVKQLEKALKPPYNKMVAFGYMSIYLAQEDAEQIEATLPQLEATIEQFKWEFYRPVLLHARAKLSELRENDELAITLFQRQRLLDPTNNSVLREIGRCYRKLKNFDEAEKYLKAALKAYPYGPLSNYEIALLYEANGNQERAKEHLQIALKIWENADPNYEAAKQARAKLAEWQS